jgi:hypothetical protein
MVFKATFNNISDISWRSVLLVEETWVSGENHWSVASHWQTLSHNVVSILPVLFLSSHFVSHVVDQLLKGRNSEPQTRPNFQWLQPNCALQWKNVSLTFQYPSPIPIHFVHWSWQSLERVLSVLVELQKIFKTK